jgi:molecular chaperone GrpE
LARLDEALAEIGISEIPCQGRAFDPQRMTAVAVERTAELPEGTVVELYRAGYQWHGRVHRLAEVKVVRRSAEIGSVEEQQEGDGHEQG